MKRSIQKWLPLLLTLALLVSCLPGVALAAGNTQPEASQPQETSEPTTQSPEETTPGETEASDPSQPDPTEPEETELPTSGKCGDDAVWTYADGVLTISGTGSMATPADGSSKWCPWEDVKKVVIGEGITGICANAFDSAFFPGAKTLEAVVFPESLRQIGDYAFSGCEVLADAQLPEGLESIGYRAFGFSGLTSVKIPAGVTKLGFGAFRYCEKLTSLEISDGVKEIGYGAFLGCTGLTSVVIPASVETMGNESFAGCSGLTSVKFLGDAPEFLSINEHEPSVVFWGVKATIYYPAGNATWTEEIMQQYGGELTWVSYEPTAPSTQPSQPAPSEGETEPTQPAPSGTETEPTAAADPNNPKTGDTFAVVPLTLACVLSMGVVTLLIVKKKDIVG